MEILELIDFKLVGLVLCILYEVLVKGFSTYMKALDGTLKGEPLVGGSCLLALFYIVFTIGLLWSYLWLPALLLLLLGSLTDAVSKKPVKTILDHTKTGMRQDHIIITQQKEIVKIYFILDKIISLGLIGWMIYIHLGTLGIIA